MHEWDEDTDEGLLCALLSQYAEICLSFVQAIEEGKPLDAAVDRFTLEWLFIRVLMEEIVCGSDGEGAARWAILSGNAIDHLGSLRRRVLDLVDPLAGKG